MKTYAHGNLYTSIDSKRVRLLSMCNFQYVGGSYSTVNLAERVSPPKVRRAT